MQDKMTSYLEELKKLHIPRYNELPEIELYMDQLIEYLNSRFAPFQIDEKDRITAAMVNNYVKSKIIPPTVKKRYSKYHVAYLIVICVFKQIYPISKIMEMIKIQKRIFTTQEAYDYFCVELENALVSAFSMSGTLSIDTSSSMQEERLFVRASVNSFAQKLLVEKYLQFKLEEMSEMEK